jgi:HSP20 family protein
MKTSVAKQKPASAVRPSSPLRSLRPRHLFEDFFDQYLQGNAGGLTEMMQASMDVAETDQVFEVKLDLPGVSADDVEIQIDNNTLTVRGRRDESSEEKDEEKQYHRIERYSGSFARSVVLPTSINEDECAAEFKDGVLKIVIPKAPEAKPRKIKISS